MRTCNYCSGELDGELNCCDQRCQANKKMGCRTCKGEGSIPVGYSEDESDGSAIMTERCPECAYG